MEVAETVTEIPQEERVLVMARSDDNKYRRLLCN
jgi:hypothetical protein